MDFILSPIALYAALGISVVFFFVLFLITGASARRRERESAEALEEMRHEIAKLREQVQEQVQARVAAAKVMEPVEEIIPEPLLPASVSVTGPAMNLTKRAQALRLHRLGTDSAEIARRLGIAQGEVRLAVKMHKILVEQNAGA